MSWAAYHASHQQEQAITPDISVLLPLFQEQSKSTAMMRHSMDVIQQAVEHVNPGQVPVITVDQPLFAICKEIQWTWPEKYGEAMFVMMLGGLHTEMATMNVLGDWLEGSGWVEALVQAKVASPGTADSFLKAAHVTRTRHVHQVTACCLHILMKKAYLQYAEMKPDPGDVKTFEQWCDERSTESVQFYFWCTTLRLELLLMTYVRSLRESDFDLYVEILSKLIPWFFALDHVNYARWASVHMRDMISLEHMHPEVVEDFRNGGFTVRKSQRPFSAMAIDQAHEQNNATLKEDGGAVGLTQNPEAFRRWSVAGPEMARMIAEFESSVEAMESKQSKEMRHLEQTASIQKTFAKQVCSLAEVITDMGNPFIEESQELICLDTHDIMDEEAAKSVRQAEELGVQQYQSFVEERLVNGSKPLSDRITKNKLQLFGQPPARSNSQSTSKLQSLKSDCSLFSRLYIACQSRDGDLNEFFRHENQSCPPSLSQDGKLRQGKKSDLLDCLTSSVECSIDAPDSDAIILDGAALVNMLKPVVCTTFNDYAEKVFLPYIEKQLERADRVDIVWDQYLENSLKSETRKRRGKGIRRRVQGNNNLPGNWQQFLRLDANKQELFTFLARCTMKMQHRPDGKQLVATLGDGVLCNPPDESITAALSPCTQEEADTRMLLHTADAVRQGCQKIVLRTVDTDVVVLSVAAVPRLRLKHLWIAFGTGQNFKYIPADEIASRIGPERATALPMFHAYTGCDVVSSFTRRGKKLAWQTWNAFDDVTATFGLLCDAPGKIDDEAMTMLEHFTVFLYDRTSDLDSIDEVRQHLFTKRGMPMESLPPTRAALVQHAKRAVYQAGHIWGQAFTAAPALPSPGDWGWTEPPDWKPLWTTLPEASISSRELLCCGCRKGCRGRCKCNKAALRCTALCQCGGDCEN